MQKGLKTRFIIHEVLKLIKLKSLDFDSAYAKKTQKCDLIKSDIKFIHNVALNALRYQIHVNEIIKNQTRKMNYNGNEYFLLLSAITQIVFLNFKEYAVVNATVELAKNKKCLASKKFINAVLRKITVKKSNLLKNKISYKKLPYWFLKRTEEIKVSEKEKFIQTITKEPDIHIVYKKKNKIPKNLNGIQTSPNSIALKENISINKIYGYEKGIWWIQDYSAMIPMKSIKNLKNKKILDLCAAPGGKTFQAIDSGGEVTAYEKKISRINIMIKNLDRLNLKCKLINKDVLKTKDKKKYDLVLVDAPCSSVGTIRRNPEIFFRKNPPNFDYIINQQYNLLLQAKKMLNTKGEIIYIVCSFLKDEGENQIFKFLDHNKNFYIKKFEKNNYNQLDNLISKKGFFYTMPKELQNGVLIDGFFAAKLIKNAK